VRYPARHLPPNVQSRRPSLGPQLSAQARRRHHSIQLARPASVLATARATARATVPMGPGAPLRYRRSPRQVPPATSPERSPSGRRFRHDDESQERICAVPSQRRRFRPGISSTSRRFAATRASGCFFELHFRSVRCRLARLDPGERRHVPAAPIELPTHPARLYLPIAARISSGASAATEG
jgi:hypothetical protein